MRRKQKKFKPKHCYGGYASSEAAQPLVCVAAETIQQARATVAAWADFQSKGKLRVRKHECSLPCNHTHWQQFGQPPNEPHPFTFQGKDPEEALRRQERMNKALHVE